MCYTSKAYVQKAAPAFEAMAVVDGQFKSIDLSQYKGKYVVLFFYPLDLYLYFFDGQHLCLSN